MRGADGLLVAGSVLLAGLVTTFVVKSHRSNVVVREPQSSVPLESPRVRQAPLAAHYPVPPVLQPDPATRVLATNQRCVGGVVITVEGSSYTQVVSPSGPVHCWGRTADRPLR